MPKTSVKIAILSAFVKPVTPPLNLCSAHSRLAKCHSQHFKYPCTFNLIFYTKLNTASLIHFFRIVKKPRSRGLVGSVLAYWTKSQGSSPRPDIKTKYEKVFLWRFPLSRFLAKILRVNKIAVKSFSKNLSFGVDFKL